MAPDSVTDWLASNNEYARQIVRLAGIKTAPIEGQRWGIASFWNEELFETPATLTFYHPSDMARLTWTLEGVPLVFRLTLDKLTETFLQMKIPSRTVIMQFILNAQTKKPHFSKFFFIKDRLSSKIVPKIWLDRKDWDLDTLEETVKELREVPRKLKGQGLI